MHWWWNNGWPWIWTLMTLGMVAFWGLIAWALKRSPDRTPSEARPSPEQILAKRLAAGEIDTDEYRQRLDALRSSRVPVR